MKTKNKVIKMLPWLWLLVLNIVTVCSFIANNLWTYRAHKRDYFTPFMEESRAIFCISALALIVSCFILCRVMQPRKVIFCEVLMLSTMALTILPMLIYQDFLINY